MSEELSDYEQFREQFTEECVLHALSRTANRDDVIVLFLVEETGDIHRVLDATRGSPDSGWFVLVLGEPNRARGFVCQYRIHDSDVHRICIVEEDPSTETYHSNRDSVSSNEEV
jgi:hypothetical protein